MLNFITDSGTCPVCGPWVPHGFSARQHFHLKHLPLALKSKHRCDRIARSNHDDRRGSYSVLPIIKSNLKRNVIDEYRSIERPTPSHQIGHETTNNPLTRFKWPAIIYSVEGDRCPESTCAPLPHPERSCTEQNFTPLAYCLYWLFNYGLPKRSHRYRSTSVMHYTSLSSVVLLSQWSKLSIVGTLSC